jgi:hypothetical protein
MDEAEQLSQRLAASAQSLDTASDSARHSATLEVLRGLADFFRRQGQDRTEARRMRELARELERSPTDTLVQATLTEEALGLALRLLLERTAPRARALEYERTVAALTRAIDALRADRSQPAWHTNAASAMRAIVDAVFLARGREPPFGEAESAPTATAVPEIAVEVRLEDARADIFKLGQARWVGARLASSHALASLADLVAADDTNDQLARSISSIRFQAERLKRTDIRTFGEAGWIKIALLAALDAFDTREPNCENRLSPWRRSARLSVAAIEPRDSLTFQRGAIQDAFRTTLDLFLAASQVKEACR